MPSINPIKYLRFLNKVRKHAAGVKSETGLSLMQQLNECFRLLRLNLLEPEEYYMYRLYRPELSWDEKTRYMSRNQFYIFEQAINPRKEMGALNKFVFPSFKETTLFGSNCGETHSLYRQTPLPA